jgi:hypothetical protein
MPGGSVYMGYTVNKEHSTPVSRKDDTYISRSTRTSHDVTELARELGLLRKLKKITMDPDLVRDTLEGRPPVTTKRRRKCTYSVKILSPWLWHCLQIFKSCVITFDIFS